MCALCGIFATRKNLHNIDISCFVHQKNICKKKKSRNFGTSMVGINICSKLSMICTTFDQIYILYKNSIRGHRCSISHIDALSMPFSMGDEKGININARLQASMPSGTPKGTQGFICCSFKAVSLATLKKQMLSPFATCDALSLIITKHSFIWFGSTSVNKCTTLVNRW